MSDPLEAVWLVDGEPVEGFAPDRALQFGDGLFETMLAVDGRVALFQRHMNRLEHGCGRLGIPFPGVGRLEEDIEALAPGRGRAVIKLIVTAGPGGRGYARPAAMQPRRYAARFAAPEPSSEGLSLILCETRLAQQPLLAGLKHCNRLEQILARQEVAAAGADEGLVRDTAGQLIEAVSANLFMVHHGRLRTPDLSQSGVCGVMREQIMATAAEAGLAVEVTSIKPDDILCQDEVFLSNSVTGIRPVRRLRLDGQEHEWGGGAVTNRLRELISRQVET